MIRDRGRIKWTAMMLPEHVEQLRDWQKEDGLQTRQQPDEQQIEEWNYRINEAMKRNEQLSIDYWHEGAIMTGKGFIRKIDALEGNLYLHPESGEAHRIPFVDLKSISESE
ncbi:YolD-like family protein [Sporosarcina sp. UB5]|uniref:YolD-like family protein n=1 Tax=Sporosarcina sp. UB5 TaxID=3047463 RepID=UPI003D7A24D5